MIIINQTFTQSHSSQEISFSCNVYSFCALVCLLALFPQIAMHISISVLFLGIIATTSNAVQITLDYSDAPDLQTFAYEVKATLTEWFPYVSSKLDSYDYTPPDKISIHFDPNFEVGTAAKAYQFRNYIAASANYYREHPDDIGSMIHELAHILQKYRVCDEWITEGIADWIRYYHYEPSKGYNKPPEKPTGNKHYTNGYGVAAYFLHYIDKAYVMKDGSVIYWINKECREGTYKPDIFLRLTGKDVDELWNEMLN